MMTIVYIEDRTSRVACQYAGLNLDTIKACVTYIHPYMYKYLWGGESLVVVKALGSVPRGRGINSYAGHYSQRSIKSRSE